MKSSLSQSSIRQVALGPAASEAPLDLPHVLLVVDGFPQVLGGGERIVLRQAALLPQYGYRASILTLSLPPNTAFQPEVAPCPVYLLPLRKAYNLAALRGAWDLSRFLRQQKVVVVQTFFESSDLWAGAVTRALSSAKLVWSRRDMGILRGKKHRLAYRQLRRLPHAVFAVSEQVRRHALTEDRIAPDRVFTIHNGIDLPPEALAPLPRDCSAHAPVIITLGNVRRVKGHDLLIRAAADVCRVFPQVRFRIAGEILEPAYKHELDALLASLSLKDNFEFVGKVSHFQSFYQSGDIFTLPSRSEGFSNALLEAMAYALPCVVSDVGGNAEAIQDGISGRVVPAEAVMPLSQALLELLEDSAARGAMGQAAQHRVRSEFSTEAMMRKTTAVYRKLMGNSSVLHG